MKQECGNCGHFIDPPEEMPGLSAEMGGCPIMKDLVPENGHCGEWIAKVEE